MNSDFFKKNWVWITGAIVGLLVIYYFMRGSSGGSSSDTAAYYQYLASTAQTAAQTEANRVAAQKEADQYDLAVQTLQAQRDLGIAGAQTDYLRTQGDVAANVGASYASIIAANAILPGTTIKAVHDTASAALQSAAQITGQGVTAAGTAVSGFGTAIGGLSNVTAGTINNAYMANAASQAQQSSVFGNLLSTGLKLLAA